jgi:hypothetical protein
MSRIEIIFDLIGQKFEKHSFIKLPEPEYKTDDSYRRETWEDYSNDKVPSIPINTNERDSRKWFYVRIRPQTVFAPKHRIILKREREYLDKLKSNEYNQKLRKLLFK